ncbi:MAG: hypothetical protein ACXVCT_19765 [Ktedonobacterales bacterium]
MRAPAVVRSASDAGGGRAGPGRALVSRAAPTILIGDQKAATRAGDSRPPAPPGWAASSDDLGVTGYDLYRSHPDDHA